MRLILVSVCRLRGESSLGEEGEAVGSRASKAVTYLLGGDSCKAYPPLRLNVNVLKVW
jgi:hypothetical protein